MKNLFELEKKKEIVYKLHIQNDWNHLPISSTFVWLICRDTSYSLEGGLWVQSARYHIRVNGIPSIRNHY